MTFGFSCLALNRRGAPIPCRQLQHLHSSNKHDSNNETVFQHRSPSPTTLTTFPTATHTLRPHSTPTSCTSLPHHEHTAHPDHHYLTTTTHSLTSLTRPLQLAGHYNVYFDYPALPPRRASAAYHPRRPRSHEEVAAAVGVAAVVQPSQHDQHDRHGRTATPPRLAQARAPPRPLTATATTTTTTDRGNHLHHAGHHHGLPPRTTNDHHQRPRPPPRTTTTDHAKTTTTDSDHHHHHRDHHHNHHPHHNH